MGHMSSSTTGEDIRSAISDYEHRGQEGNNEMRITYVGMRRWCCEKICRDCVGILGLLNWTPCSTSLEYT